jgi:DNA polymerase-1
LRRALEAKIEALGTKPEVVRLEMGLLWERRAEVPSAAPVLFIHDEIVDECAEADSELAAQWLRDCMVEGMDAVLNRDEPYVPVEVEVRISDRWSGTGA